MKLYFRKYGNGKPLIILHGLFGSGINWNSVGKILARNYTVYIPDQRNHGKSPHSHDCSYEHLTQDLVAKQLLIIRLSIQMESNQQPV